MQKHISKRIIFRFINRFTKQEIIRVSHPYLPFLATSGYYSRLYKSSKVAAALECEKSLVSGKKWFEPIKNNRSIISLPNGLALDYPYDVTKDDIKIILHQIEGVRMSLKT